MVAARTNAYKKEKRNQLKSLTRESLFISDYVSVKYKAIHQEAATLYNKINMKNPRKYDLRKTIEYKCWKNTIAEVNNMPLVPIPREKRRALIHREHRNIPMDTVDLPVVDLSTSGISLTPPSSESPENPPENITTDTQLLGMTMQLNIPLMEVPTSAPTTEQCPENILTTACEEITLDEGEQTRALEPTIFDGIPQETMDKIIAELQQDSNLRDIMNDPTSAPTTEQCPENILTTACEEITLDEGEQTRALEPTIFDGIPQETMDKIIAELQQDSNLRDIMNDIESTINVEEELVGLTLDLPDPLEDDSIFW